MSEYQYYEFQAIDRPLTEREMRELRSYSTRARITPTSFVNDYSWGNFKGDEDAWMEKYFDAFLYLANWGTHIFMLRLPTHLLPLKTARLYCNSDCAAVREKSGKVVVTFRSDDEEGGDWVEGEGNLSSLISLRAELARGDLRCLYLGWLLGAQNGEINDEEAEPPVPAGLAELSASLESFAEFLRIDTDLLKFAAKASSPLRNMEPKPAEVREWLAKMPLGDKDVVLMRLILENDGSLGSELVQLMRRDHIGGQEMAAQVNPSRTVRGLLDGAERVREERKRREAEKAAKEKVRREREGAAARAEHLNEIAGQEPALWRKVNGLIASKQPKNYDQAVELLTDLRDLAAKKVHGDFRRRMEALRTEHARKPALMDRLQKAGL